MAQPTRPSLLADITHRFIDQRELVATTALCRFLESPVGRSALLRLLGDAGVLLAGDLVFRTEVVAPDAEGRPDVVGHDPGTQLRRLIIEGKFWAALTEAQPVGYLASLPPGGCLLLVAPGLRFPPLWSELVARTAAAVLVTEQLASGDLRVARVGDCWMAMVSWGSLLTALRGSLLDAGDHAQVADLDQLSSLCELEDSEAFLPLTATDLERPSPLRVYQFLRLVEAVRSRGLERGIFRPSSLTFGAADVRRVRYVAAGDMQCGLSVDFQRWTRQRLTPLWCEFAINPGDALRSLEHEPVRVFYDRAAGRPVFPINLRLGAEHSAVVDHVLDQIAALVAMVEGCERTVTVAPLGARAADSGSPAPGEPVS